MRTGLLLLMFAQVAFAAPGKFVIADVVVNGIAQRPAMIMVTADGAILARRNDVTSWNLNVHTVPTEMLQNIDHVRLTAMNAVKAQFDGAVLTVEASESAFQGSRIDLRKNVAPVLDSGKGAYINYDFTTFAGRGLRQSSAAAVDVVAYIDALSFASNGVVTDTAAGRQLVRYESNLRWDFPDRARSFMVGDSISRSSALARAFRFGGISYGSNFATRPDMVTFALPAVPGESRIPTSAELLINGQAHSRVNLASGPFEISNVPAVNGAGEIQLVTRDPLGRQQVLVVPYYVTPALLRHGLTDAGFEMGAIREDFGLENFNYGRRFARGLWRRGMTPTVTVEGFAETARGQHVAGAGLTTTLGNLLVASASAAASDGSGDNLAGNTFSASLERSSRGLSFGLRGKYSSRHFSQLGEISGLHYSLNASTGFSLGALGNISVVHATESRYDRGRIATTALSYQKQLGKSISVLANVNMTRTDEGTRRFAGLALIMPLGPLAYASLSSTRQDGRSEHVLDVRQSLPVDEGWATRARVTSADIRRPRVDGGLTWQNHLGQWSADASYANSSTHFRLGMNGSIVVAGGVVRVVRQLGDAFGIVSVPGFPGIDVFHENQRVAQTDASGFAIIPRLRPYESNAISLDTLKLSLSTELKAPRRMVTPARRAGVFMQFKAATTHGALVQVVKESGEQVPAGALLKIRDEAFMIAGNGEAWVTGLDADTDAEVEWRGQRCTVRIPASDPTKIRPRIGPLTCKGVNP